MGASYGNNGCNYESTDYVFSWKIYEDFLEVMENDFVVWAGGGCQKVRCPWNSTLFASKQRNDQS